MSRRLVSALWARLAAYACLAMCACVIGCAPTREPSAPRVASPSAVADDPAREADAPSSQPARPDAPAAEPKRDAPAADSKLAPGALVEVWAIEGPLARGYEPLNFEPPSWSLVWLSSASSPEPLGGTSWVARVRGVLRIDDAGPRELELDLPAGARFVLDGEVALDELAANARATRRLSLGELARCEHPFELVAWGNADDVELGLAWRTDDKHDWQPLSRADWAHERTLPRTAPGVKRLKQPLARRSPFAPPPELDPAFTLKSLQLPAAIDQPAGIASLGASRWLVVKRGSLAAVRLVDTSNDAPRSIVFASGLDQPGGIATSDGRVFVAQKNELTELVDRDGDGTADEYRVALELPGREFARPCGLAVEQGLAALLFESDSGVKALVASLAEGRTTLHDLRGATRASVSPGFGGAFLVCAIANEPSAARLHWLGLVAERAWSLDGLPAFSAPTALARVQSSEGSARFALAERGRLGRLFVAAAPGGFELALQDAGRVDDELALCASPGDGSVALLSTSGGRFDIVRPNGGVPAWLGARGFANGFELEFAEPLALDQGWESENWKVGRDGAVGSPEWVSIDGERRRVFLASTAGSSDVAQCVAGVHGVPDPPWYAPVWCRRVQTQIGVDLPRFERVPMPAGVRNFLTDAEREEGWRLLFDGTSTSGWRNYGKEGAPAGWAAENGELVRVGDGGDLVTEELFDSFELELDWRLWSGGNGGVFFHVVDGFDTVWRTGPEFQLLDNAGHADGQNPLTSAGSNYALHAPEFDDTNPITTWNHARLVVDGAHVEHWLNGVKQCEYELWTDAWKARVAGSKFAAMPDYGLAKTGRIALQDHGDRVAFKNVKLRPIVR
ncbi:MAG: DUF1080 domain-containing protein [Planctomycetes bacterium]|nr:DUF1080 domain-containing protein [Planctomycetota bacterium]